MKRAILAIGFIVSCFLPMFVSGPAFAQSEATHDRAAGHIEYTKRNSHQLRIIDFDIHEAYVHHPANGTMTYTIKDARNENVLLIMEFDVVYVNIRGNTAKFIAYCTDASNNGPKAGNAYQENISSLSFMIWQPLVARAILSDTVGKKTL